MSTKFIMTRDINGYNGFGLPFGTDAYPTDIYQTTLATGVAQNFTVPDNFQYWIAIFMYEPGTSVFVASNETAAVAGGAFAATKSHLLPSARQCIGGDVLSFITPDTTAYVNVALYAIQPFL